jgi:hypothetical protein
MQIVWNSEAIEKLKGTHTLLELETFDVEGRSLTTYCVVPPEKIGLAGFAMLGTYKNLHEEFIKAYKSGNGKLCTDISEHLMGKFGGELDSFYEEILKRFSNT